jgi:hypothetical protein
MRSPGTREEIARPQSGERRNFTLLALFATGVAAAMAIGVYAASQYWLKAHPLLKEMGNAVAALLFGATATSFLTEMLFHSKIRRHTYSDIEELIRTELDRKRNLDSYGLSSISERVEPAQILDRLSTGDLLWILDTYDPTTGTWLTSLEKALDRGVSVRILSLTASGPLAEMRAMEAFACGFNGKEAVDHYRSGSEHAKRVLCCLKEKIAKVDQTKGALLEVRHYDDLPCAPMYLVERGGAFVWGYSSYFLREPTSFGFPHFEWRRSEREFGARLLHYVKHKWKNAQQPGFSKGYPLGQWIYTLTFSDQTTPQVYGKFFIYQDGVRFRCDGEAYYKGFKPDRLQRRGLWRSTSIHLDGTKLTINFDMLVQNDHPQAKSFSIPPNPSKAGLQERGPHYQGKLEFKEARDFDSTLVGDILQKRGIDPMVGTVKACRLGSPSEIPIGEAFQEGLRSLFKQYKLCDDIFQCCD